MKLFVTAAVGAALLAGCAPFEHGHYAEDVSYKNTTGDSPGTPLVYQHKAENRAVYDPTAYATLTGGSVYAQPSYASYQSSSVQPSYTTLAAAPQQYSYSAPATYSAQSYVAPVAQSYVTQPAYQAATSYVQPATQSTYSGHAGHNHSVHATTYGGVRVDAEGYAICDIPWPAHGAHERPRF